MVITLLLKKIVYFGACLRGTSQYRAQRSKELRSLIQNQINKKKSLPSFLKQEVVENITLNLLNVSLNYIPKKRWFDH